MHSDDNRPGNGNDIQKFIHCAPCVADVWGGDATGRSPESYARLSVGWTPRGLQVWCVRHDANVINIDFEGHRHPANTTRRNH